MSAAPGPVPASAPADPWHRVHPLTPVVKGWLAILVLAGGFVNIVLDDFVRGYLGGRDSPAQDFDPGRVDAVFWWVLAGIVLLVLLVLLVAGAVVLVAWWFTRYQVTPEHVRVR